MYGYEHGGLMSGGGLTMLLWWLVPLLLVVAGIYVFRQPTRGGGGKERARRTQGALRARRDRKGGIRAEEARHRRIAEGAGAGVFLE